MARDGSLLWVMNELYLADFRGINPWAIDIPLWSYLRTLCFPFPIFLITHPNKLHNSKSVAYKNNPCWLFYLPGLKCSTHLGQVAKGMKDRQTDRDRQPPCLPCVLTLLLFGFTFCECVVHRFTRLSWGGGDFVHWIFRWWFLYPRNLVAVWIWHCYNYWMLCKNWSLSPLTG